MAHHPASVTSLETYPFCISLDFFGLFLDYGGPEGPHNPKPAKKYAILRKKYFPRAKIFFCHR